MRKMDESFGFLIAAICILMYIGGWISFGGKVSTVGWTGEVIALFTIECVATLIIGGIITICVKAD